MAELQASRTLVKSGPELWAECSDAGSLAKHLGEFGEITITKLEPENTVAWEGDAASGTVKLEPAGWGTRVTLTAFVASPVQADSAEARGTVPGPEAVKPPLVESPPVEAPAPEPPGPEPAASESSIPEPEAPETPEPQVRQGFLRRLFGGRVRSAPPQDPPPTATEAPVAEPPIVSASEPEPEPEPAAPVPEAAVLVNALDSLGAAHRRPFSRS